MQSPGSCQDLKWASNGAGTNEASATPSHSHRRQAGDASGTGLFDTAARTWDARAIEAVDPSLKDKLPPLLGPGEVILAAAHALRRGGTAGDAQRLRCTLHCSAAGGGTEVLGSAAGGWRPAASRRG